MQNREEIERLRERVRRLSDTDPALECDIFIALGWSVRRFPYGARWITPQRMKTGTPSDEPPAPVLSSVDAAMTFLEEQAPELADALLYDACRAAAGRPFEQKSLKRALPRFIVDSVLTALLSGSEE
jgi:hypothetical protein